MIKLSNNVDLGNDKTRMINQSDIDRQTKTSEEIVNRFKSITEYPWAYVQILADEVGMGKTFVALAVAYSILEHLIGNGETGNFQSCSQMVLIVTPDNEGLNIKWQREVREFVSRCIVNDKYSAKQWFAPKSVLSSDDFRDLEISNISGPRVLITKMNRLGKINPFMSSLRRRSERLPLVIVDEAHNWKNGRNGFKEFNNHIAPNSCRALLLTATPFQLRPQEMLKILEIGDNLSPSPDKDETKIRKSSLKKLRTESIGKCLNQAKIASDDFYNRWKTLSPQVSKKVLADTWESENLTEARKQLQTFCRSTVSPNRNELDKYISKFTHDLSLEIHAFMISALKVFARNCDLSHKLGRLVIRHRRRTEHRLVRVGNEYEKAAKDLANQLNQHVLHEAPGLDVQGEGELPHYILMRCVSLMKKQEGRKGVSSLGSNITGCYSTLMSSSEGKNIEKTLQNTSEGRVYWDILKNMITNEQDSSHPKVERIVEEVVRYWKKGEKSLIFCFRVNTAERLHQIISDRIEYELGEMRKDCLGEEGNLSTLLSRLNKNTGDLVHIALDRALWSFMWAQPKNDLSLVTESDLHLKDNDFYELALLSLMFDIPLTGDKVDNIFMHRCVEYVIAKRLKRKTGLSESWRSLLNFISDLSWVEKYYGTDLSGVVPVTDNDHFDEKGLNAKYKKKYNPSHKEIDQRKKEIERGRSIAMRQGHIPRLDRYSKGPSLWFGSRPTDISSIRNLKKPPWRSYRLLHKQLFQLSINDSGLLDWNSRKYALHALRRSILRESILVRLLPTQAELEDGLWGDLIVKSMLKPLPDQSESMADKLGVYLEDMVSASGSLSRGQDREDNARMAIYKSSLLEAGPVTIVTGGNSGKKASNSRDQIFTGFNTPLPPEVLVCTQVGQEGIDLHRQCRHVIHYDLAWNPAVIEQRTGRVDRLGSKCFRELNARRSTSDSFLEVGLPYLAATYDERMYEQLRLRSQVFEVLLGGDIALGSVEGNDEDQGIEGVEEDWTTVTLPDCMVRDLRVNLQIWDSETP